MQQTKMEKILAAALEVFAAQGFDKATVDEICLKAGVAKGTVFYHYKTKEDLFIRLIEGGIDLLVDTVKDATSKLTSPTAQLRAVIEIQTSLSFQHSEFFSILQSEFWGKQERQQVLRRALRKYFEFIDQIVATGIAQGEFIHADPENLSAAIFGMTSAAVLYSLLTKKSKPPEQMVKDLQACLLHGILA